MKHILLSLITNNQKQILLYLYKFRFLHTFHLQKLFNHKDSRRVREWLKDLIQKGYINSDYNKHTLPHKPAVYSLTKLGRKLLKGEEDCDIRVLNLVYRRQKLTDEFINRHLTIADLYFFFLKNQEKNTDLHFLTKYNLVEYEYLQSLDLSAYLAVKTKQKTNRYFLNLFDPHTPSFVYEKTIRKYLKYYDENTWQENTENKPFPNILFVCHNESAKKRILHSAKALIEKEDEEKISLFLTTMEIIQRGNKNVWEKV